MRIHRGIDNINGINSGHHNIAQIPVPLKRSFPVTQRIFKPGLSPGCLQIRIGLHIESFGNFIPRGILRIRRIRIFGFRIQILHPFDISIPILLETLLIPDNTINIGSHTPVQDRHFPPLSVVYLSRSGKKHSHNRGFMRRMRFPDDLLKSFKRIVGSY